MNGNGLPIINTIKIVWKLVNSCRNSKSAYQDGYNFKRKISVGKNMENWKCYIADGNRHVEWYRHVEKVWQVLKKLNIELP